MSKQIFKKCFFVSFLCILFYSMPNSSWAQEKKYPTGPVTLLCGFPPGGGVDVFARFLAKGFEKHFRVPVVVENKPGGGGVIAASILATSRPDGYTLGALSDSTIIGVLLGEATYSMEDFYTIGIVSWGGSPGWFVSADSPWKTIEEFVDYARKNPGTKYANAGVSSAMSLIAENLNIHAKLMMVGVPFKGEAEIITAIIGKHVPIGIVGYGRGIAQVEAGKMRALLSNGKVDLTVPSQSEAFGKTVPFIEAGYILGAPRKTPDRIIQIIENTAEKVVKDQEFINAINSQQLQIKFIDSKTFISKTLPEKILNYKKALQHVGLVK